MVSDFIGKQVQQEDYSELRSLICHFLSISKPEIPKVQKYCYNAVWVVQVSSTTNSTHQEKWKIRGNWDPTRGYYHIKKVAFLPFRG